MNDDQLDLLLLERGGAHVLAFPVDREARRIREVALQIDRRSAKLAERYWKTECNRLYGRLQLQGLEKQRIEAEIDRFARAIRVELQVLRTAAGEDRSIGS